MNAPIETNSELKNVVSLPPQEYSIPQYEDSSASESSVLQAAEKQPEEFDVVEYARNNEQLLVYDYLTCTNLSHTLSPVIVQEGDELFGFTLTQLRNIKNVDGSYAPPFQLFGEFVGEVRVVADLKYIDNDGWEQNFVGVYFNKDSLEVLPDVVERDWNPESSTLVGIANNHEVIEKYFGNEFGVLPDVEIVVVNYTLRLYGGTSAYSTIVIL